MWFTVFLVSNHAALRYIERVMELEVPSSVSKKQMKAVKSKIQGILGSSKSATLMGTGEYTIDKIIYCIKSYNVTTVKLIQNVGFYRTISGGRTNSGAKIKKFKKVSYYGV